MGRWSNVPRMCRLRAVEWQVPPLQVSELDLQFVKASDGECFCLQGAVRPKFIGESVEKQRLPQRALGNVQRDPVLVDQDTPQGALHVRNQKESTAPAVARWFAEGIRFRLYWHMDQIAAGLQRRSTHLPSAHYSWGCEPFHVCWSPQMGKSFSSFFAWTSFGLTILLAFFACIDHCRETCQSLGLHKRQRRMRQPKLRV